MLHLYKGKGRGILFNNAGWLIVYIPKCYFSLTHAYSLQFVISGGVSLVATKYQSHALVSLYIQPLFIPH